MVITIAHLHSTKPEFRFSADSDPAHSLHVEDLRCWGSLAMVLAANKAKCLSLVNHTTNVNHHKIFSETDKKINFLWTYRKDGRINIWVALWYCVVSFFFIHSFIKYVYEFLYLYACMCRYMLTSACAYVMCEFHICMYILRYCV